ncbi:MAG: ParA family protein, partial [Anaerolineae bacterium]
TSSLGVDKNRLQHSIYDVLLGQTGMAEIIQLTGQVRLDLAPSAPALAGAEVELVTVPDRERLLSQALEDILPRYDFVLIDCPP